MIFRNLDSPTRVPVVRALANASRHSVARYDSPRASAGPLSVGKLAAAAGLSQRALELGFQETLEVSPRRFLLWNRMNGFQRNLRAAGASSSSVTEIASHWGFGELGRTAINYRELFGESPFHNPGTRLSAQMPATRGCPGRFVGSANHPVGNLNRSSRCPVEPAPAAS